MIALTITSSKRLDLFKETLSSFSEMCEDKNMFDIIIHYDDMSSYEDRTEMSKLLQETFKDKIFVNRYLNKESFSNNMRHANIMHEWYTLLDKLDIEYVFHLEDDWKFIEKFKLQEGIDLLMSPEIAYVGWSQPLRDFPADYKIDTKGDYWKWVYFKDKGLGENLFSDEVELRHYNVPGMWLYFINWPYFSLRPGIHDFNKLRQIGDIEVIKHFELEYSKRFTEKFVSYYHTNRVSHHIGDMNSSYEKNNSER